jgi:hypothetical protein
MIVVIGSSEMSILTSDTRRNILEDDILHSHDSENLKSYIWWILIHAIIFASGVDPVHLSWWDMSYFSGLVVWISLIGKASSRTSP